MPLRVELTVRVEIAVAPVKDTLVGEKEVVSPDGDTAEDNVMVPVKLETLVKVIVEVAGVLARTVSTTGLAVMLKLGGLAGLSLANLTCVGAEVPST